MKVELTDNGWLTIDVTSAMAERLGLVTRSNQEQWARNVAGNIAMSLTTLKWLRHKRGISSAGFEAVFRVGAE